MMYRNQSIKTWLLSLAFLAMFPLFVFSLYTAYQLGNEQKQKLTAELLQRTEATANAVSERLAVSTSYLSALATSDAAQKNDLAALYEHAKRIVEGNPHIRAVTLIGPDGRLIFITLRPFGTTNLPSSDTVAVQKVFTTGKPAVSAPFKSPLSESIVTTVGVPVFRGGKVAYCLRMVLLTDSLNMLLAAQKLPAEWTSAIIDSQGLLIARSRNPERFVGKEVSPTLMAALRDGRSKMFDTTTLDGIRVTTAAVQVPGWDWKVAIGVPVTTFEEPLRRSLGLILFAGLVLVIAGSLATLWLSRFITGQVTAAVRTSRALAKGVELPESRPQIKELHELGESLRTVEAREQKTNSALLDMAVRHEQVSAELSAALCDGLTGLPGRATFLERVEGLRKAGPNVNDRKLAVLFIDLDGFKQVNDTLGHDAGDQVLVRTAEILKELTRETDVAGRLGGDEFVVCLTAPLSVIEETARNVAARIVQQVSEIGSGIGCSIGISIWANTCPDLGCVMKRADEAMYMAKKRGKNQYVVYGEMTGHNKIDWLHHAPTDQRACTGCAAIGDPINVAK